MGSLALDLEVWAELRKLAAKHTQMKQLIFAFMLLAALQSNGQSKDTIGKKRDLYFGNPYGSIAIMQSDYNQKVAIWKQGSDTLEVFYGKIKFIKIGTEVFEITSPSLTNVSEKQLFLPYYKGVPNSESIMPAKNNNQ